MKIDNLYNLNGQLIHGPKLLKPNKIDDNRGFFMESWNKRTFNQNVESNIEFVQDNHSCSSVGVLRGLHYQLPPHSQGKLVRCIAGEIFDVAIDLRRSSSSFGQWVGVKLSSLNYQQLWIPEGFAHGFLTLSRHAEVLYKVTDYWNKDCERVLSWKDPFVSINWPSNSSFELSDKDSQAPLLDELGEDNLF